MKVYEHVTVKPYGYVMIDNQPKTTSEKQVVSNVFEGCKSYPNISTNTSEDVTTLEKLNESEPVVRKEHIKRKMEHEKPHAKKQRKLRSAKPKGKQKQKNTKRRHTPTIADNKELCDNSYHLYDI